MTPLVQFAGNLQSYNRYSYVLNNPLTLTDPSGFSSWTDFRDGILKPAVAVAAAYFTGMYVSDYFLVGASNAYIATGATSTTFAAIGAEAGTLTMAGAATTGAAGGFAGGLVASGGDLRVAGRAAATGALFGMVGNYGYGQGWETAEYVFAHSAVGCVSGALSSEGCGPGALSAGFGKYVTLRTEGGGFAVQGFGSAVAGGVASWAGGGQFASGAGTAALGYVFNQVLSGAAARAAGLKAWYQPSPAEVQAQAEFDLATRQIAGQLSDQASAAVGLLAIWAPPGLNLGLAMGSVGLKGLSYWLTPPTVAVSIYDVTTFMGAQVIPPSARGIATGVALSTEWVKPAVIDWLTTPPQNCSAPRAC